MQRERQVIDRAPPITTRDPSHVRNNGTTMFLSIKLLINCLAGCPVINNRRRNNRLGVSFNVSPSDARQGGENPESGIAKREW